MAEAYIPTGSYIMKNDQNGGMGNVLTVYNSSNKYVLATLIVDGDIMAVYALGLISNPYSWSVDLENQIYLTGNVADNIYAKIPNNKNTYQAGLAVTMRVQSFNDGGYTSQYGVDKDTSIYAIAVVESLCNPTFTDWELEEIDTEIIVKDQYDETLVTSQTQTLTDSASKAIKGYSGVRSTVSVANKMVARDSATENYYWFQDSLAVTHDEKPFSAVDPVILEIPTLMTTITFSTTAYDSRNINNLTFKKSLDNIADYSNVTLSGLTILRDNNVDSETVLSFGGTLWDNYFGGGSDGTLNGVVGCDYRYKETTESWGAQSWNDISADVDVTDGVVAYSEYIDGDLGASGYATDKSYNIQVRLYDNLSVAEFELTLSKGIPLIHFHPSGIAIMAPYDEVKGESLQVDGDTLTEKIQALIDARHPDCYVAVRLSGAQTVTQGATGELIEFATEDYDTGSNFNTGTHLFTATSAGLYSVQLSARYSNGTGLTQRLFILKNSAAVVGNNSITVPGNYHSLFISAVIPLAINDTLGGHTVILGTGSKALDTDGTYTFMIISRL